MWAVIGGTGFEGTPGVEVEELLPTKTPFGEASPGFKRISIDGQSCLYMPRHGSHHELLPSEVNYCANFYALKAQGATKCLTLSSVGSLRYGIKPGDVVVPSQFVNRTMGKRRNTFCGQGVVAHVALGKPVWPQATDWLRQHAEAIAPVVHFDKIYVCIEGPCFSTQAESQLHRSWGCDIVGMTAYPECALAREAGMCYFPLCFACDYDCWGDELEHVSIQQIVEMMARNRNLAFALLKSILQADIAEDPRSREGHIGSCLLSSHEQLKPDQKALIELMSR